MRGLRFETGTLVKVLIFTVIAIILTVLLGMRIANVGLFGATYRLEAVFSNAAGVFEGDAVKLSGVDVGRVTGTRIEDGNAVVTFQVDGDVPVPRDSRVGIRWRNVIGLRFLYLYPGTSRQALNEGDRIPLSRTDDAGDIGEFLNRLGPILQAIDAEKANAFIHAVNTALAGNETAVRALFTDGASLATDLGEMDREIRTLITSSDTVLGAYAGQSDAIDRIIEDLDVVGGELAGMTDDINSVVTNFAVVQRELARLLRENRGDIDGTIDNLDSVARTLALNRRALSRTLCTFPAGVAPYDMTSSWGEWFNVRIIEIVLKDNEGEIIASVPEDRPERSGVNTRPFTTRSCTDDRATRVRQSVREGRDPAPPPRTLQRWVQGVTGGAGG